MTSLPGSLIVAGCPTKSCNGKYNYDKLIHGKPSWLHTREHHAIYWNKENSSWNLEEYETKSPKLSSDQPPSDGWQVTTKMTVSASQPDLFEPTADPIRWMDGEPIFVERCRARTYNGQYDYRLHDVHGKPSWLHETGFPSIWWNKADTTWNVGVYEIRAITDLPPSSGYVGSDMRVSAVNDNHFRCSNQQQTLQSTTNAPVNDKRFDDTYSTSAPISKQASATCLLSPRTAQACKYAARVESLYGPAKIKQYSTDLSTDEPQTNQPVDGMMVAPNKLTYDDMHELISLALEHRGPQLDKSRFQAGSNESETNVATDTEQKMWDLGQKYSGISGSNNKVSTNTSEKNKEEKPVAICKADVALCMSLGECIC